MFGIFGGGGADGAAQARAPAPTDIGQLQQLLTEKDEEIDDLTAKVTALRTALHKEEKDDMDHFEMAIAEKNKVLEEQFNCINELKTQNARMAERIEQLHAEGHAKPPLVQSPVTDESDQGVEGSAVDGEPNGKAAAPDVASMTAQLQEQLASAQAQLAAEQQVRMQAEQHAQGMHEAATQLQAHLMTAQQEVAMLQDGEGPRMRSENEDLRQRLASAIGAALEAKKKLSGQDGTQEVTEQRRMVLEGSDNIGVIFAPREARCLGHGWPVARVREGSWAEREGVLEGDELHNIDGQMLEVLPEQEVIGLLQKKPIQLDWVRRLPSASTSTLVADDAAPETVPAPAATEVDGDSVPKTVAEPPTSEATVELDKSRQREASLQEQLRLSREENDQLRAMQASDELLAKPPQQPPTDQEDQIRGLREEIALLHAERDRLRLQVGGPGLMPSSGDDETDGPEVGLVGVAEETAEEVQTAPPAAAEAEAAAVAAGPANALAEAHAEITRLQEALHLAEEKAAQPSSTEALTPGGELDGWGDFTVDETAAAPPAETDGAAAEKLPEEEEDSAKRQKEEYEADLNQLREAIAAAEAQLAEKDVEREAQLAEKRSREEHLEQMCQEDAAKLAESQARVEDLEAKVSELEKRVAAAPPPAAPAPSGNDQPQKADGDGWDDFGLDVSEVPAPAATPAPAGDVGGWDFDIDADGADPANTQATQKMDEQSRLLDEARGEVARLQQALQLKEDGLDSMGRDHKAKEAELESTREQVLSLQEALQRSEQEIDQHRNTVQSHEDILTELRDKAHESDQSLETAHGEQASLLQALQISEKKLQEAQERVCQAEEALQNEQSGALSNRHGDGGALQEVEQAPPADDGGWDVDIDTSEAPMPTTAPSEVNNNTTEALEEARCEAKRLGEALRLVEQELGSAKEENARLVEAQQAINKAPPATEPTTAPEADSGGWDFQFGEESPAVDAQQSDNALNQAKDLEAFEQLKVELEKSNVDKVQLQDEVLQLQQSLEAVEQQRAADGSKVMQLQQTLEAVQQEKAAESSKVLSLQQTLEAVEQEKVAESPKAAQAGDASGWGDFDLDDTMGAPAPEQPAALPSVQQQAKDLEAFEQIKVELEQANVDKVQLQDEVLQLQQSLEAAEQQRAADGSKVLNLMKALEAVEQERAAESPKAAQAGDASGNDGWGDFDLDDTTGAPAPEQPAAPPSVQQQATAPATAGAGGWDFDFEDDGSGGAAAPAAPAAPSSEPPATTGSLCSEKEIADAQAAMRQAQEERDNAQNKVASLTEQLQAAERKVDGVSDELQQLQAAHKELQNQTSEQLPREPSFDVDGWDVGTKNQTDKQEATESLEDVKQELERAKTDKSQLQEEVMSSQERCSSLDAKVAQLQQSLEAADQQRATEEAKVAQLQQSLEAAEQQRAADEAKVLQLQQSLEATEQVADAGEATDNAKADGGAGWDFDDFASTPRQPEAPDPAKAEVAQLREALQKVETDLCRTRQELEDARQSTSQVQAPSKDHAKGGDAWDFDNFGDDAQPEDPVNAELVQLRETLQQVEADLSRTRQELADSQQSVSQAQSKDVAEGATAAGGSEWDLDFDLSANPVPEPSAKEDTSAAAAQEARDEAEQALRKLRQESEERERLQAALDRVEEEASRLRREHGDLHQRTLSLTQDCSEAQERAQEAELALTQIRKESEHSKDALLRAEEECRRAQEEAARLQQEKESLEQAPAEQQDANKEDDGWDFDFAEESNGRKKASPAPAAAKSGPEDVAEDLLAQVAVATERATALEDELRAERAANGAAVATQMRKEVASLTDALVRERRDRERQETHLGQQVRQAQEDLRQQAAAARAAAGAQADASQMLERMELLRQQRDQARSIAQCVARETSHLAEELYRLRVAARGGSESQQPPPGRDSDPEHTAAARPQRPRPVAGRPAEEDRPEAEPSDRGPSSRGITAAVAAASHSTGYRAAEASPSPNEEGEQVRPRRPSVEVTSGWDVFDPDDQFEHTVPQTLGDAGGWDTGMNDLLAGDMGIAGGPAGEAGASGGTAPELSPVSPVVSRAGDDNNAINPPSRIAQEVDFDLEQLLGQDLI